MARRLKMAQKQVTLKQIAEEAEVSIATVSRVLRDEAQVSEETEGRVREAAQRLRYRPNLLVRGIQTGYSASFPVYSLIMQKVLCGMVLLLAPLACAQPPDPPRRSGQPPEVPAPRPQTIEPLSWEELSRLLGGPSLLTMHLADATPQQVVNHLGQQSPLPISLFGSDWRNAKKITAVFERQPFWPVIRELEQQGGFVSTFDLYRPGIQLHEVGPRPWIPLGQEGPFDFTFRSAELVPQAPEGEQKRTESELILEFRMLLDPKVRLLDDTIYCRLTEALDDQGHSLLPDTPENDFSRGDFGMNQCMLSLHLFLRPHAAMSKRLKRVSGEFRTLVATRSETWEVPNPLQATNQMKVIERGNSRDHFLLDQVRQEDTDYIADLTIAHPQFKAPPFYQTAGGRKFFFNSEFFGPVRLLDEVGRDIGNCISEANYLGGQDVTQTTVKCKFHRLADDPAPAGVPVKLVITVPTEWRELVVPFEFNDLPLPGK